MQLMQKMNLLLPGPNQRRRGRVLIFAFAPCRQAGGAHEAGRELSMRLASSQERQGRACARTLGEGRKAASLWIHNLLYFQVSGESLCDALCRAGRRAGGSQLHKQITRLTRRAQSAGREWEAWALRASPGSGPGAGGTSPPSCGDGPV